MTSVLDRTVGFDSRFAESLNRGCVCRPLDPDRLCRELEAEPSLAGLCEDIARTRPHMFSATAVFISNEQFQRMATMIAAVKRVVTLRESSLAKAPRSARLEPWPLVASARGQRATKKHIWFKNPRGRA
jgi:hypothetical protein